jgi:hypothetical protein
MKDSVSPRFSTIFALPKIELHLTLDGFLGGLGAFGNDGYYPRRLQNCELDLLHANKTVKPACRLEDIAFAA